MKELLQWLQDPANLAILSGIAVAFSAALRVVGELFLAIGKLNPNHDRWDSIGAVLSNLAVKIGKLLTWLGIGNKK